MKQMVYVVLFKIIEETIEYGEVFKLENEPKYLGVAITENGAIDIIQNFVLRRYYYACDNADYRMFYDDYNDGINANSDHDYLRFDIVEDTCGSITIYDGYEYCQVYYEKVEAD